MRIWLLIPVIGMLSCKGKKDKVESVSGSMTIRSEPKEVSPPPDSSFFNALLKKYYPGSWHVLNDAEATWMKDAFDYFIAPKRKDNPVYPYMTSGDFNGDGKQDRAALITDSNKRNYQLAVILDSTVIIWKEDIIEDAALSTVPRSEITGMEGEKEKKVKMKGDGINVEYFEKASFVLYWDKKGFKRLQTGD